MKPPPAAARAARADGRGRPPRRGRGRRAPRGARSTGTPRGSRRIWPFLGPAFIAAVAYIDPGNFATNIAGGAKFGYLLLWVVLGGQPDRDGRPDPVGEAGHRDRQEPRRALPGDASRGATSIGLWLQAELVAMACDIAEVVGAALGLNLLFGIPLFPAGLIAGAGAFAILALQQRGFRRLEAGITVAGRGRRRLLRLRALRRQPRRRRSRARTSSCPGFAGTESILLATGIIGATVMPHVIYLHSALTQRRIVGRNDEERRKILGFEKVDVVIALSIAGVVNLSMMIVAAGALPRQRPGRDRLDRRRLRRASKTLVSDQRRDDLRRSPCSPPASPPPRSGRWPGRW